MNPTDPEVPNIPGIVEEPDDFKPMLIGASVLFVTSFIPFAALACCLPHIGAALLAVHLFTAKYALTLTAGRAMKLGIFTCLMGAIASWAVMMAIYFLLDYQVGKEVEDMMVNFSIQMTERGGNQAAADQIREQHAQQRAQGWGVMQISLSLLGGAVFAAIAGVIGGAIGAAIFKRGPKELKQ